MKTTCLFQHKYYMIPLVKFMSLWFELDCFYVTDLFRNSVSVGLLPFYHTGVKFSRKPRHKGLLLAFLPYGNRPPFLPGKGRDH